MNLDFKKVFFFFYKFNPCSRLNTSKGQCAIYSIHGEKHKAYTIYSFDLRIRFKYLELCYLIHINMESVCYKKENHTIYSYELVLN